MPRLLLFITFCFCTRFSKAQQTPCNNPGQNPQTAFPVCGTTTFTQNSVPLCGNRDIVGPCGNTGLTDRNPYWYKFTCYTSGTLGFSISPLAGNEDYDWQLFNVTGVANLDAVYTNAALFVTCSWSGFYGNTGASAAGTTAYACEGNTPLFVRMPNLVAGNSYLLMISHFTPGQSGYNLSFGGGSASITDPLTPRMVSAIAACDGVHINLKLNKRMQCSSLATNGSDFKMNTTATSIISAAGFGCSSGFDLDSLQLTLSNPLPPGTYTIKAKLGTDLNTLFDLCGTQLPVDDSIDLVVAAQQPVPLDSIRVAMCSPGEIYLEFQDFIRCNTIAPDGSDFVVTGPSPVNITQATGICNNTGLTKTIKISLAAPIQTGGTYKLQLQNGSDANTLLNNCNQSTPLGSSLNFVVRDSVSALFNYNVVYNACAATDTVRFTHAGGGIINLWNWTFLGGVPVGLAGQNAIATYNTPGTYLTTLKVSNGFCTDSVTLPVTINTVQKDTILPKLATAKAPCEGTQILIKLNKKIKCSSIAANGSDFSIRPALATFSGAFGFGCGMAAETDSIVLSLGNTLPTGIYTLLIKNGSDGNTLLDNCSRAIPVNDSINNIAVVFHNAVTMDSIAKPGCKPNELVLFFREPVQCGSIVADGSDFNVTGTTTVAITQAAGICNGGFTNVIKLTLGAGITKAGNFQVVLKNGSDGNTLLNECNKPALPGGSLPFVTGDTVSAAFTYSVAYSCKGRDTVSFLHNGNNGITQWRWRFDNGIQSTLQNPVINYATYGSRPVSLSVTNGICTDSTTQLIFIASDTLHASFEASTFLCPSESLQITNRSTGNIASYAWDYGDGFTTSGPLPQIHTYPVPATPEMLYTIRLAITGSLGCTIDTAVKMKALNNCVIAVPSAFTPNGDGLNDYLYPTNAYKADKMVFRVFNRFGQPLFEARIQGQKWDGKVNGVLQPAGAYVWMLNYVDLDTGKPVFQKGTSVLIY